MAADGVVGGLGGVGLGLGGLGRLRRGVRPEGEREGLGLGEGDGEDEEGREEGERNQAESRGETFHAHHTTVVRSHLSVLSWTCGMAGDLENRRTQNGELTTEN